MAELNTTQTETLGIMSEVIADAAFTVLSMLLGREIDLVPLRSAFVPFGEIDEQNWNGVIVANAGFTKGIEGSIYFLLNIEDATRIVDLMLGGEGESASELDEDSSDALSETINQIMGASCQTLTEKSGESISIGQVEIQSGGDSSVAKSLLGEDEFAGIEFSLDLEDLINSKMYLGLDGELLDSIDRAIHKKDGAQPPAMTAEAQPAAMNTGAPPPQHAPAAQTGGYQEPMAAHHPAPMASAPIQGHGNIDLLMDIELPIIIRIGKTELMLQDILKLTPGAIIELNKSMDDPIDMMVNNKLVARGEVVVVDGNFAFRITEIVSPAQRIRSLG